MTIHEGDPLDSSTLDQVEALTRQLFGDSMDLDKPILGITDDDIVAANIHEMLRDPATTVATLTEGESVIGFSVAIPIGAMDPKREAESSSTAYIYFTGIEPSRQGQGLVGVLMQDMADRLRAKGFAFMERDCVLTQGYADSVEKAYQGAIVEKYDHTRWPAVGPERFFRIDLSITPHSS